MAVKIQKLKRVFMFNGAKLPDPGSELSIEQVRTAYAAHYPEIATAVMEGPEPVGGELRYSFAREIGTKG